MAFILNRVELICRVVAEPRVHVTKRGNVVQNLRVVVLTDGTKPAFTRLTQWTTQTTDEEGETRPAAPSEGMLLSSFAEGDLLHVTGELTSDSYDAGCNASKNGKHYTTDILVERVSKATQELVAQAMSA